MTTELSFRFFDCIKDLRNFDYTPAQCQAVMRDNGRFLATRRPA
ncbi:MAG TPA: hypothetical protein VHZ03_09700 [Trebonia sp.]|jgi:hypothetical protein|nr:hypothetical protein [Trebonia sp.]